VPKDEVDEEDPLEIVGVELPVSEEELAWVARCFIEEFALFGYGREALVALFRDPQYRGVHDIYRRKGEAWVARVVDEVAAEWGAPRS